MGELAVYPGQGVIQIEAVQAQEVAGQWCEFLVLRKLEDRSKILVPRERVDTAGLRAVIPRREVERVWQILREADPEPARTRAPGPRGFRDYEEKLREGSVFEVAEVLRDLLLLQTKKDLSFTERKLMDSARSQLVQELAAAQKRTAEEIEAEIRETVK